MIRYALICLVVLAGLIPAACKSTTATQEISLFDLQRQEALSADQAIDRLKSMRLVLVGEHHNNAAHHRAQLQMIRTLNDAGRNVAIGLEMFQRDSQATLDQWVNGQIKEVQFKPIYLENWNFDWKLYGPIFNYARNHRVPMVGLNVSRKITSQVAYHGFESLSEDQKGFLEGITCNVTAKYRAFIREAYGGHGHGNMNFNRFCEAQLVWDTAMAMSAIDYLNRHPDTVMVILAGSGHARKPGIPTQLKKRIAWPYAVVLPETKGIFDALTVSVDDADFLLLNP